MGSAWSIPHGLEDALTNGKNTQQEEDKSKGSRAEVTSSWSKKDGLKEKLPNLYPVILKPHRSKSKKRPSPEVPSKSGHKPILL